MPDIKRSDCTLKKALNWKMKKSRSTIKYTDLVIIVYFAITNVFFFLFSLKRAINKLPKKKNNKNLLNYIIVYI